MEEENIKINQNLENLKKEINWNMDNKCLTSCSTFLGTHTHFLNALTFLSFIIVCFIFAKISNFINNKNLSIETESLFFVSVMIYSIWNFMFGLPIKILKITNNETNVVYKSYSMSFLTSVFFGMLFLIVEKKYFCN